MANYKSGFNRINKVIFLSEEARTKYAELVKNGLRMALLIENYILKIYDEEKIKNN